MAWLLARDEGGREVMAVDVVPVVVGVLVRVRVRG